MHANADTRHEPLSCLFSLFFDVLPHDLVALLKDEGDECYTNKQCQAKQDDVDRNWIVLEDLVRRGVKSGLREIEDTGQADDKTVDFAEGGKPKDFGGVIAVISLAKCSK